MRNGRNKKEQNEMYLKWLYIAKKIDLDSIQQEI